ncbi:MAG: Response regulator receiver and domain protein [Pseudonocardiales bacterium]|nr:Response regulator receiver and domain protein [Jatrophihabitantaceae bacterium]MCW2603655.1 Response regulator receiver and domain protein [Pseudonocardiales bacterium]
MTSPSGQGSEALAEVLATLARDLQAESTLPGTLQTIVDDAVATIPGAAHAGLTIVLRRRDVQTKAATDELVEAVDRAQYETGEGPCLDAVWDHDVVNVPDLAQAGDRWPAFAPRAVELGIRSMVAFQLFVEGGQLGALNLYSAEPDAFTAGGHDEQLGRLFATHAAIALAAAQQVDQLESAVRSRDVIGMAKGMVMQWARVDEGAAFRLLVKTSQNTNRKLHDVASELVRTGAMPKR